MCFLMCSHLSKILFAVYRQKADCSNITSMLNAVANHFLRYKTSLMVFHDSCDMYNFETSVIHIHIGFSPQLLLHYFVFCFMAEVMHSFSDNISIGKSITFVMDM